MLTYRDVLERYDRAKAFGETRDLSTYSKDMNDLYGTDEFSQGQRDGWWTRASTRADQALEGSIVGDVLGGVGGAVGGAFGYGAEGEKIGRQTPRMLLNAAPLFIPGLGEIYGGALAAGGTGALMGAHTFADTGSARAAAISGVTGAAMPYLGGMGAALGLKLAGAPLARGLLTESGAAAGVGRDVGDFVSKRIASSVPEFLAEYGGSQAAMAGTQAVSAKVQNPEEDVLSKDFAAQFLLGQIPFTAHDVYRGAKTLERGLPSREAVASFAKPEVAPEVGKPFVPKAGTAVEQAGLDELLSGYDKIASDPTKTAEEKSTALANLQVAMNDPEVPKTVATTGATKKVVNVAGWSDGRRIVVDAISDGFDAVPEHKTMFFDPTKVQNFQKLDEQGNVSFSVPEDALVPAKFGIGHRRPVPPDPNQPTLPTQEKAVSFAPKVNEGPQTSAVYGRELGVHDAFRDIRSRQPLTQEDVPTMQEMGLPETQIKHILLGTTDTNVPEPTRTQFNPIELPDGRIRFKAYHGTESGIREIDDRAMFVSSHEDGAGYGKPIPVVIEGKFLSADDYEPFLEKHGIDPSDLFHDEASSEQAYVDALRKDGYDGGFHYDQRADDGDAMPAAIVVNPKALVQSKEGNAVVKEAVHQFDVAKEKESSARAKENNMGRMTGEQLAEGLDPEKLKTHLAEGKSPAQAVQVEQTKENNLEVDAALVEQSVARQAARARYDARERTKHAGHAVTDAEGNRRNFDSRSEALAALEDHAAKLNQDPEDFDIRNGGRGRGFYLVEKINRRVSMDIQDSGGHERVSTQAEQDVEETSRPENPEAVVDETTQTNNMFEGLRRVTPVTFAGPGGDVAEAVNTLKLAHAALDKVQKGEAPAAEEMSALRELRAFYHGKRSPSLNSQIPHDEEVLKSTGYRDGGIKAVLDWYVKKSDPGNVMGMLVQGLSKAAGDLKGLDVTEEPAFGFNYTPGVESFGVKANINIPWFPTTHDVAKSLSSKYFALNIAHEVAHHVTRDMMTRNDPAAVEFRKTLGEIRKALKDSSFMPKKVRGAIEEAEKTGILKKYYNDRNFDIVSWFNKRVGKENEAWHDVFYAMQSDEELIASTFNSPNTVKLLAATPRAKGLKETVIQWFSRAWQKLMDLPTGTENALGELLASFDDYIGKPKSYNGVDFLRDRLVVRGTRAEGLASRVYGVKGMLKDGLLSESVEAWKRDNTNGLLPVTTNYVEPSVDMTAGVNDIAKTILSLPKEAIPGHRDLWMRLQGDVDTAREYAREVGGVNDSVKTALAESAAKVNAMRRALLRYERDIQREESLDNFDPQGWRRSLDGRLRNAPSPDPADPVGNLDLAQEVLGLRAPSRTVEEVRKEAAGETLKKGTLGRVKDFVEKNFMLRQHFASLHPADAARSDVLGTEAGEATQRASGLNFAYNFDPEAKVITHRIIQNNQKVASTERLAKPAVAIRLIANEIVKKNEVAAKQGKPPGPPMAWEHPDVQKIVRGLSKADQESLKLNYNAWKNRWEHNVQITWPEYYDRYIPVEVASTIAAREGILPDSAKQLSESYYGALKRLRDPAQAPGAMEELRQLATQISPATSVKVVQQMNSAILAAEQHIAFIASRSHYTSEQRYGKFLARMKDVDGKSRMEDGATIEEVNAKIRAAESRGSTLVDMFPRDDTNVGGTSPEILNKIEEIEHQSNARRAAALEDVDPQIKEELMSQDALSTELRTSLEALKPLPGVTRKFVKGRENLDLLANDDQFYLRQNNYMRHKLTRAGDRLARLHPEVAGNRELKKFGDQMLEAFLTPDNEIARRLTSATFFYKLAFEFGNNFLESFQHLTTGMQALISETGSVGDALDVTTKATKDFWKARTTGKWASADQEWLVQQMIAHGHDEAGDWNDIHSPETQKMWAMNDGKGVLGRGVTAIENVSRKWSSQFQRYGNFIGMLSGFEIARSKGMDLESAFKYAVDSKNLGMYTGGKAQRGGVWRIKTKAVPQLMTSLQTYTMGWFGQMYRDYVRGFSKNRPTGLTRAQIEGSKKAFLYGLAAQATLAGALGLPGVGQGMALLQQGTGVDLKGWVRGHLQSLFDEDQEGGGLISGLALNGVLAGVSPFDPSGRANMSIPFTGVDSFKGFSVANLAGAPGATLEDFAKGMMSLASGDAQGAARMLPNVLKRPARLLMDEGDVRDTRGGLLYELSPAERAMTLAGLPPTRVQRARDVAEAAKRADLRAVAKQQALADSLAKMFTEQGPDAVKQKLVELKNDQPELDLVSLVKSIGTRRQRQLTPYDWRREVNPAAELQGLSVHNPSSVALGRQIEQQTTSALGLRTPPNPRADAEAVAIDHLLNSGAAKTEGEARKMLQRSGGRQQLAIPGL